jgi:hypothetical protein
LIGEIATWNNLTVITNLGFGIFIGTQAVTLKGSLGSAVEALTFKNVNE